MNVVKDSSDYMLSLPLNQVGQVFVEYPKNYPRVTIFGLIKSL